MVYLADHAGQDAPIGLKTIAQHQDLSLRYLEQLVVPLKNASLLRSVVGKHGGYYLARAPKDIHIGEIVEAAIGPVRVLDCIDASYECRRKETCTSRRMWGLINTRITDVLYDYSLEDLSACGMQIPDEMKIEDREGVPCPL